MTRTATLCIVIASVSISAQTMPDASKQTVSVTGCLAPVQRDGSTGAKGTGTTATPESAPTEANNPEPTGKFLLQSAAPVAGNPASGDKAATGKPAQPEITSYTLRGQEQELSKHVGHRVQITGTLMPPLAAKLPSKTAATAEGTRTVQVASVKMLGTDCSAKAGQK